MTKTTDPKYKSNGLHIQCFNNMQSKGERGNESKTPDETTPQNHSKNRKKKAQVSNTKKTCKKNNKRREKKHNTDE